MKKHKPKWYRPHSKLICDQQDKKQCMVHYKNLKFYVKMGMIVETVHCVVSFNQRSWLKKYIDYCGEKRKTAKTDSEVIFPKKLVVSFFGKTMEYILNKIDVKFFKNNKVDKFI